MCEDLNSNCVIYESEANSIRVPASEGAIELNLDIDELYGLYYMCMRPTTKLFLSNLITCLKTVRKDSFKIDRSILPANRKWSDIVAGRSPNIPETSQATPQPISTIITSQSSRYSISPHELTVKKTFKPSPVGKRKTSPWNTEPTITIVGDSHARGMAGELLHHLNHRHRIIGLVKPNADLTEVLNSASKDLNKLTKANTLILFGGSNDFANKVHRSNLTSLVNFLEDSQHTNIILLDVPLRYDIGIGSSVNEQIIKYNKQLHKIIKHYKHVIMVRSTTKREHFTRHGFHLNRVGKEVVSKEIINYLSINQSDRKAAVLRLPWKEESGRVGIQSSQTKELSVTSYITMTKAVDDVTKQCVSTTPSNIMEGTASNANLTALPSSNEQQGEMKEPDHIPPQDKGKTGCIPKSQRNCPKLRNKDFLWT